jgi:asparagine synthase (glutamine-hydrolysing)
MPGVCIEVGSGSERAESAVAGLSTPAHYRRETVVDTDDVYVGYTTHPGYPVATFETDDRLIYVEGELYDRADGRGLRSVTDSLLDPAAEGLAPFLRNIDGEFVVVVVDRRTGDVALVNDVLARLPLYYHRTDDGVVVGREPGFVLERAGDVAFDQMGLAQTLLLRYTLGDRTLWRDVRRLQPATRLVARADGEPSIDRLHRFDFGSRCHRDRSVAENAAALADRFRDACRRRTRPEGWNVVSLSGGLDSRAVAAGVRSPDARVRTATFERADGATDDHRVASRVADALNLRWDSYELSPTDPERMAELLRLKQGLNPFSVGFVLEFLDRLAADRGHETTYFTGDGGDKTLPDISPTVGFADERAFTEYLVSKNAVLPLDEVTALVEPSAAAINDEIAAVVGGYPETDWSDRYVHFLVHERGINWLFEGEDRNRCYFWSTTPFYAADFFRYAMNVPDEQKARYELYREFLRRLWPPATRFEHADFGQSLESPLYGAIQRGLRLVDGHPWAEKLVKRVADGSSGSDAESAALGALLERQLRSGGELGSTFAEPALERITAAPKSYSETQLYTLLTLTSAVARHHGDGSGLERAPRPVEGGESR